MSSFTSPLCYEETGKMLGGRMVYRLTAPFSYIVGSISNTKDWSITVPVGFETDLASIPYPLSKLFPPDGPWAKAAVIHDYLYKSVDFGLTQFVADAIFYEAMRVSKVNLLYSTTFWLFVRVFGNKAYKARGEST